MADKDYTSLLGKSSGTSWGEIAGAYLSKSKKKDKQARNILLATLFFNLREARLQSNVLKNLKENDEQQTFELQNRGYAFEQGLKKQEQYDAVKEEAYNYYQDEAETLMTYLKIEKIGNYMITNLILWQQKKNGNKTG